MEFLDPESRGLLGDAGAEVERTATGSASTPSWSSTDPDAPVEFQPAHVEPGAHAQIGGDHLAYGSVGSPPNIIDLDGVRRPGDRDAFRDLLRLCQTFNTIHFVGGYPVEPIDLHHSVRHLQAALDVLTLTDKSLHSYSLGRQRNRDIIEMARIARQVDEATLNASRRCSPSSTRSRRCASTRRCCKA